MKSGQCRMRTLKSFLTPAMYRENQESLIRVFNFWNEYVSLSPEYAHDASGYAVFYEELVLYYLGAIDDYEDEQGDE